MTIKTDTYCTLTMKNVSAWQNIWERGRERKKSICARTEKTHTHAQITLSCVCVAFKKYLANKNENKKESVAHLENSDKFPERVKFIDRRRDFILVQSLFPVDDRGLFLVVVRNHVNDGRRRLFRRRLFGHFFLWFRFNGQLTGSDLKKKRVSKLNKQRLPHPQSPRPRSPSKVPQLTKSRHNLWRNNRSPATPGKNAIFEDKRRRKNGVMYRLTRLKSEVYSSQKRKYIYAHLTSVRIQFRARLLRSVQWT